MIHRLQPNRVRRSYFGGNHIDALRGQPPAVTRFPEEWIASCTEAFNPDAPRPGEGLSLLEGGVTLRSYVSADPVRALGSEKNMRILFKLLDTSERLVIQAHPTRPFAREYFRSDFGKTESWYILQDGGSVFLGFREGITSERWRALFEAQDVDGMLRCLHHFPVRRGDMIFVAGGVPHAIGAGCFLAELQEPTDLMVIPERVTPSGIRLSDRKMHCGLGFDRMFGCFDYTGYSEEEIRRKFWISPQKTDAVRTVLLEENSEHPFQLERYDVSGVCLLRSGRAAAIVCIEGNGFLGGQPASAGDCFFLDADSGRTEARGRMTLLLGN